MATSDINPIESRNRSSKMRLRTENGTVVDAPGGQDIARVVGSLGAPGNTFAILEAGDDFVQILANGDSGFVLQFSQGGTLSELRNGRDGAAPALDKAVDAMGRFAAGRRDWRRGLKPSADGAYGEPLKLSTKIILAVTGLLICATLLLGFMV